MRLEVAKRERGRRPHEAADADGPRIGGWQIRRRRGAHEECVARSYKRLRIAELGEIGEQPRVEAVAEQSAEGRRCRAGRAERHVRDEACVLSCNAGEC